LNTWKEIAVFFDRDVRTVQLWEKKEGLPVRRHTHSSRASVYAYAGELEAWQRARTRRTEIQFFPATGPVRAPKQSNAVKQPRVFPLVWESGKVCASGMVWALGGALLACLVMAAVWYARRPAPIVKPDANGALAVLPFLNLSGSSSDGYLSDGFTDELTTVLSSHFPMEVVARSSAFRFKGSGYDAHTIGERLNAEMLVEGSLENHGGQIPAPRTGHLSAVAGVNSAPTRSGIRVDAPGAALPRDPEMHRAPRLAPTPF
jgi:hypothetical protein